VDPSPARRRGAWCRKRDVGWRGHGKGEIFFAELPEFLREKAGRNLDRINKSLTGLEKAGNFDRRDMKADEGRQGEFWMGLIRLIGLGKAGDDFG